MEDSLDEFQEEIKGKSKKGMGAEGTAEKKSFPFVFCDEGNGMVHGADRYPESGIGSQRCGSHGIHWKTHEEEDENAAVEGHTGQNLPGKPCKKEIHLHAGTERAEEESRD